MKKIFKIKYGLRNLVHHFRCENPAAKTLNEEDIFTILSKKKIDSDVSFLQKLEKCFPTKEREELPDICGAVLMKISEHVEIILRSILISEEFDSSMFLEETNKSIIKFILDIDM